jgi:hypothetical protein
MGSRLTTMIEEVIVTKTMDGPKGLEAICAEMLL